MKKLHISSVKSGDILAKSILQADGKVLLAEGVQLSTRFIERLKSLRIDSIYIQDDITADIIPEEAIRDETRRKAVQEVHKSISTMMDFQNKKSNSSSKQIGSTFRSVFGNILEDLRNRKDILVHLSNLNVMDGYLFHHSVNVAILAGIIGIAKNYNTNQLIDLGVGALLFDIGMTKVPIEVLNKTTALTNEERKLIQNHTKEGFDMLRNQHDISLLSAHCALQHHERFDGSGYPRQLQKSEIHEYAQIVAISDFYDALISPRPHRKAYSPNEATEFLFAAGDHYFDYELIQLFVRHIAVYPVSTTVKLNTGQIGVVTDIDPVAVHRPVIRIIQEMENVPCLSPYEIDLQKKHNIVIMDIL